MLFGPYKCNCCNEVFDEPRVIKEYHGFDDHPEIFYICPYCGGDYTEFDPDEEVDDEEC